MTGLTVPANAKEVRMTVRVVRCGCGDPDSHNGVRDGVQGRTCSTPLPFDDALDTRELYWHRNPLRRLWWGFTQLIK